MVECRPPTDTPDGAWCQLVIEHDYGRHKDHHRLVMQWNAKSETWSAPHCSTTSAERMGRHGWRFESVVRYQPVFR